MGHRKLNGPGYRTDSFVRGDGALMAETIYDPDGNVVSHRSAEPGGPGLRPARLGEMVEEIHAAVADLLDQSSCSTEASPAIREALEKAVADQDAVVRKLYAYGYAERVDGRAVLTKSTYQSGKGWSFEPIDLGPLPEDAARIRRPQEPLPSLGASCLVGGPPSPALQAYLDGKAEASALAEEIVCSEVALQALVAAATEANAREQEDSMDAYAALLDRGAKPAAVLCRAAVRILPPAPFYSEAATLLRRVGGLNTRVQKDARKTVKRWCEGGRQSAVPAHCWALLLRELPQSSLKERLAKIGGAP